MGNDSLKERQTKPWATLSVSGPYFARITIRLCSNQEGAFCKGVESGRGNVVQPLLQPLDKFQTSIDLLGHGTPK